MENALRIPSGSRRPLRLAALGLLALTFAVTSCADSPIGLEEADRQALGDFTVYSPAELPSQVGSLSPGFHWLHPVVSNGAVNYSGAFDPQLDPVVVLLECSGEDCNGATEVARSGSGLSPVRYYGPVPGDREEHYRSVWQTKDVPANPDNRYRIEVMVDGFVLGYAEVHVVERRNQLGTVDDTRYVGLVNRDDLRIAFRIEKSLAKLASERGLHFGAAVAYDGAGNQYFPNHPRYTTTLGREFNMLVGENIQKWFVIRRDGRDAPYRLFFGDEMLDFAETHGMLARGHTLGWHSGNPPWLDALQPATTSREEAIELLETHIEVVAGHWKGRIRDWDVVNEVIRDGATLATPRRPLGQHVWERLIGPDWVDIAFHKAAEVVPEARLFYNDYSIEGPFTNKQNHVYNLVVDLIEKGVPIHGVGFQGHFSIGNTPSEAQLIQSIDRFAALGLEVQFTELDIGVPGNAGPLQFAQQADQYRRVVKACLEHSACNTVVVWGVNDASSWRANNRPLLFDGNYNAKPAYFAVRDYLLGR